MRVRYIEKERERERERESGREREYVCVRESVCGMCERERKRERESKNEFVEKFRLVAFNYAYVFGTPERRKDETLIKSCQPSKHDLLKPQATCFIPTRFSNSVSR